MSYSKTEIRIMKDLIELSEDPIEGTYLSINEENIYKHHAMIIGPKNTPYFGGFYFFEINFKKTYPKDPPYVKFLTTDGKVRFNPNLYQSGKVCLSILGTWSGPSWRPIMTLKSVLLSIASLMGENPIRNEPSFEKYNPENIKSINYNLYIIYYNYKLAILDVIREKVFNKFKKMFEKEINDQLNSNYNELLNDLLSYSAINKKVTINREIYFLPTNLELDFVKLSENFSKIMGKKKVIKI